MLRNLALGLIAASTIGAAALAPTAASAFTVTVGNGWYPHHQHRVYVAPPMLMATPVIAPSCYERRMVQTRKGLRWRTVNVCAF